MTLLLFTALVLSGLAALALRRRLPNRSELRFRNAVMGSVETPWAVRRLSGKGVA